MGMMHHLRLSYDLVVLLALLFQLLFTNGESESNVDLREETEVDLDICEEGVCEINTTTVKTKSIIKNEDKAALRDLFSGDDIVDWDFTENDYGKLLEEE